MEALALTKRAADKMDAGTPDKHAGRSPGHRHMAGNAQDDNNEVFSRPPVQHVAFRAPISHPTGGDMPASAPVSQPFSRLRDQVGKAFTDPTGDALVGGPMGFVPRGAKLSYDEIKTLLQSVDDNIIQGSDIFRPAPQAMVNEGPVSPFAALARDAANPKGYESMDRYANDMARMDTNASLGRPQFEPGLWEEGQAFRDTNPITERSAQGAEFMRRYTNRQQ